ncbi:hypothetical protein [Mesobacillus sp. S13]|uniref:hypothetical protein n=1 Tax=Mesobacillus sp. S13 TaxID=2880221 RepID=UPI001CF295F0|nr:hypothetical protein [Mesobacillus sp. S13]
MEYLTDEDYEIAEKNGINRRLAYQRFYMQNFSKRRAITQPVKKSYPELQKFRKIALENGIKHTTFISRIKDGWTPEEACVRPLGYKRPKPKKYTDEHLAIAAKNGIKATTVKNRVGNLRWPIEKAITYPVNEKFNWREKA